MKSASDADVFYVGYSTLAHRHKNEKPVARASLTEQPPSEKGVFTRHGSRGRTWLAVAMLVDSQHSELVADSVAQSIQTHSVGGAGGGQVPNKGIPQTLICSTKSQSQTKENHAVYQFLTCSFLGAML